MKKLICDRCGAEFSPLPEWAQAPEFEYKVRYYRYCGVTYGTATLDLCRDCQNALDKWMIEKKVKKVKGGDKND